MILERSLALATLTVILEAGTIARVNSPRRRVIYARLSIRGSSRLSSCGGAYPYHSFPAHLHAIGRFQDGIENFLDIARFCW